MRVPPILPALLLAAGVVLAPHTGAAEAKSAKKGSTAKGDDLFAHPAVLRIKIEIPSGGQEALRKDPKEYVKATVRVGDTVLTNTGVRLKGQTSYQSIDKRPGLTLKFNEFIKGQELSGRTKVMLNNSLQDPTCIGAVVASEIFREASVPSPKCTFARVELNGRDLGLYSLVEAANKDFLSEYFKKTKGNLYEGDKNDIIDKLEKDSGDDSTDQSDLKALAAAARESDLSLRWKRLGSVLDVERFVSFAALEVLVCHHDGYSMDHNNYRIYHDPGTGQMTFIVHGLDDVFGKPDATLTPEWKGLVAKSALATSEGRKRYGELISKYATALFKADALTKRVDDLAAVVRPTLAPGAVAQFDSAVAGLRDHIAKRASYIQQAYRSVADTK